MKKLYTAIIMVVMLIFFLTGCGNIKILALPEKMEIVELEDKDLRQEVYYVKNGTRFASVYMPQGNNVKGTTSRVDTSRVIYFNGDENMVPIHYKGELIAYSSTSADFSNATLERFMDMGYSIGLFGGQIGEDGYYHIDLSEKNVVPGSQAGKLFDQVISSEIRIISIGGDPISKHIDSGSGIITGLEKDKYYTVEFYAGTYYYQETFKADIHYLRAFEIYNYGSTYISDTTHGYRCFNTPDLKSGWYTINGAGLFLYHNFERGKTAEETVNLNEGYYASTEEMIATYSKQYKIYVPNATRDMKITVLYEKNSLSGNDFSASVFAPDGTSYDMTVNGINNQMTLSLAYAEAGDWNLYIYPQTLGIQEVYISNESVAEETVCEEAEFNLTEDTRYQRFYADVSGNGKVYGSIIGPEGITYSLELKSEKSSTGEDKRYLIYDLPYAYAGQYKVKIYHYLSDSEITNIQMFSYESDNTEIIIID